MTTYSNSIDGFKPPEPEKVVCSDPKKLLAEISKATAPLEDPPGYAYFTGGVNIIGHYLEGVWERSGCSCEPYREELAELETKRIALLDKIGEIDRREHPDLDSLAIKTKPWVREWLREQVLAGKLTDRHLQNAANVNGEPYSKLFVKDVIAGWRPSAMRPNGGKA